MQKTTSKKHRFWRWLTIIVTFLLIIWLAAGMYFFKVGMVPGHKSFISSNHQTLRRSDPLYHQKKWFREVQKQRWTMTSASKHYRLVADYIPAAHATNKSVLICHGFMNNKATMGAYAAMFHQMGYNVLLPDARAHGESEGRFIGYGWPERYDTRKWIQRLIQKNGQASQIVMFGVSMGGATTMMTSGLKLPHQVKAFIEDCGYTSLSAELDHEARHLYHLPPLIAKPAEASLSIINRIANGFFTSEASAIAALHHNHRPMLFIHGAKDTFVPTEMVYANYKATRGPKALWVVPQAGHAKSFQTAPRQYQRHIQQFLSRYVD
ncbi:alpha/beta hydrolase [uncultured Limosilactobacillus sp.]|uniref:alpha/beta hydrolase n=1 Tax=uncultured Limosilactobacillus sp. TaxID=2837629 RepID=UPI0025F263D3|nr:alpha/beta hydrolase [uncultured Limosilactobacillus sp.]